MANMRSKRSISLFQAVVLRCALIVACLFIVATLGGPEDERRPQISDEALERALNDKRYLQRQLKCALGEASCDSVGRRLKSEYCMIASNLLVRRGTERTLGSNKAVDFGGALMTKCEFLQNPYKAKVYIVVQK